MPEDDILRAKDKGDSCDKSGTGVCLWEREVMDNDGAKEMRVTMEGAWSATYAQILK